MTFTTIFVVLIPEIFQIVYNIYKTYRKEFNSSNKALPGPAKNCHLSTPQNITLNVELNDKKIL